MSPIFSALAAAATAIGTAAGATGAVATAIGAGVLGAGAGLAASDITQLVNGNLPWKDSKEWFGSGAKAAGMGALGGAVGSAIGPALGAAGDALGIGSNVGTIPAEVGAPSGALDITGNVAKEATEVLSAGSAPTDAGLSSAIEKALPGIAKQGATGLATGALNNTDDPLKGALMGGASGIATGVFQAGSNAAFRGMDNGFWSPQPKPEIDFKIQTPGPQDYSLLRTPQMGPQASMQMSTPQPQFGGRVLGGAANMGGNLAGSAARMSVGSAMTPPPPTPEQNPYAQWGVQPYWMRPGFR